MLNLFCLFRGGGLFGFFVYFFCCIDIVRRSYMRDWMCVFFFFADINDSNGYRCLTVTQEDTVLIRPTLPDVKSERNINVQSLTCSSEHSSTLPNTFSEIICWRWSFILCLRNCPPAHPPFQLSALQLAQNLPSVCVGWAGRYIFFWNKFQWTRKRSNCLTFAAWHYWCF